jgi:hypothetical protein
MNEPAYQQKSDPGQHDRQQQADHYLLDRVEVEGEPLFQTKAVIRESDHHSIRSDFGTFGISVVMRCIVDRNM